MNETTEQEEMKKKENIGTKINHQARNQLPELATTR